MPRQLALAARARRRGRDSPDAARVRERLRDAVLASRAEDWTFGREDERVLATACAALALAALGERGRTLALIQLALAGVVAREHRAAVPFTSTIRREPSAEAMRALLAGPTMVAAGGRLYQLTSYEDTSGAIQAGLVALALSRPGDPAMTRLDLPAREPEPRYRCRSLAEYAALSLER